MRDNIHYINGKKYRTIIKFDKGFLVVSAALTLIITFSVWQNFIPYFIPFILIGSILLGMFISAYVLTARVSLEEIDTDGK